MSHYRIQIELADGHGNEPEPFHGLKNRDALHEALCKALHEHDRKAMKWLRDNVTDIR